MQVMDTTNEFVVERTGIERRRYAPPESPPRIWPCRLPGDRGRRRPDMDQIDC